MKDTNYDGAGNVAAKEIEPLLLANQASMVEVLVQIALKIREAAGRNDFHLNEVALRELHRCGLLFLVAEAGAWRSIDVSFEHGLHTPPPFAEVDRYMKEFFAELPVAAQKLTPIDFSAWVIWRINFIHPFRNGNGRTSRAFGYACLCLGLGMWLPGRPTVLDELTNNQAVHTEYVEALFAIDASFAAGALDLSPMSALIERLLVAQLSSLPPALPVVSTGVPAPAVTT